MQCTSFVPIYYQPRSINGASGFSWHLSSSNNVNHGVPRIFDSSLQPLTVNPYSSYDKDVVRQIIQNHEAVFRHQVHELHRLYKRQRELMDEMKMKGAAVQQHLLSQTSESLRCLSQPQSDITQTSHTPSWLLGNHLNGKLPDSIAENIQRSPNFVLDNIPVGHGRFGRKSSCPEVEYLWSGSNDKGKRILDLEVPADVEAKQFKDGKFSKSPDDAAEKVCGVSVSLPNLNIGKRRCLIDLNEPVQAQLESLSSNSTGAIPICDPCVSGAAKAESPIGECVGVFNNCDGMAIDLNSIPVSCFSEMESATENLQMLKKESDDDDTMSVGDIGGNFLKTQTNINVGDGNHSHSCPPSASGMIKAENEDPPYNGVEPQMHLAEVDDMIAARALIMISDPGGHCLKWFAEIVCSNGDDLENKMGEEGGVGRQEQKIVCCCSDMVKKSSSMLGGGILEQWGNMRRRTSK